MCFLKIKWNFANCGSILLVARQLLCFHFNLTDSTLMTVTISFNNMWVIKLSETSNFLVHIINENV